jgi:hypothetical protein
MENIIMRKHLGWITPFALLALATAGCGSPPGDEGNANDEATPNEARAEPATPGEQTEVGKEESAVLGWAGVGWAAPIGWAGVGWAAPIGWTGVGWAAPIGWAGGVGWAAPIGWTGVGWAGGFGAPIGFGFGAFGGASGFATGYSTGYAAGFAAPGWVGFPGVYGGCGGWAGCGGAGLFGFGFKDGKAEAPNVDVAREVQKE